MKIIIKTEPKEIAALVVAIQERQPDAFAKVTINGRELGRAIRDIPRELRKQSEQPVSLEIRVAALEGEAQERHLRGTKINPRSTVQ